MSDLEFVRAWDILIALMYPVVVTLFSAGIYGMAASQVRGEFIEFPDLFRPGQAFGRLVGFSLLSGALITVGLMLCVVPGALLLALWLPAPAMIANGAGVWEAMGRSIGLMGRSALTAVGLALLLSLLLIVGFVPCGLGLLVAQPLWWLVSAVAARDLTSPPQETLPGPDPDPSDNVWPPPPVWRSPD